MRYTNEELTELAKSALNDKENNKDDYNLKVMFLSAMSGVPVEQCEVNIENYAKGVFE